MDHSHFDDHGVAGDLVVSESRRQEQLHRRLVAVRERHCQVTDLATGRRSGQEVMTARSAPGTCGQVRFGGADGGKVNVGGEDRIKVRSGMREVRTEKKTKQNNRSGGKCV